MTVWDSMALNAPHTEREIGDESNIKKPDIAIVAPRDWLGCGLGELFADHASVVRGIIAAAGELPNMNEGPFKDGFRSGMEEVAARADITAGDGGHQMQDLAEQIIALITGEAFLVMDTPENATCPSAGGFGAATWQAILSAIAAEKATWPHAGALHDGARMACDAIAERVKKLMGVA